ncbi:MAG: phenylalanine--tRNA ligase subunit alpha [Firmicutes bacterium]|nr:phenylalanine--tRNA ligase subunit alpha [Bacillota bacterium]
MLDKIEELKTNAREAVKETGDIKSLEELKIKYLGKKGEITAILRAMKGQREEIRPLIGRKANELRRELEKLFGKKIEELENIKREQRWEAEKIDVTLPGNCMNNGKKHPITVIMEEVKDIFTSMGFQIAEGPEVELDYYNFEALNFPPGHPARDMQDSFFITSSILLRTHTSPVQIRVMEERKPDIPVRIIAPGKVFRRDDDISHSPMFHQVEGLAVDHGINFANLKGVLLTFAREMFGQEQQIRLRPSFFPFTEPSAEVDILCIICGGEGCRVCGQSGWLEVLGAGMVHPDVLKISGYNPREVTGFAFGMGIERIAMLKYGIDDIRLFYVNDLRMLKQL